MGVRTLHDLLRHQAKDGVITRTEVEALIAETRREGVFTPAERFTLEAALQAHRDEFTQDAWEALVSYLHSTSA